MQERKIDPLLLSTQPDYSISICERPVSRLRVIVANDQGQILELKRDIENLLKRTGQSDDLTRTPEYFLARIREKRARPFAVAVYDNDSLAGIVYGARRCIFGIPVGLLECGDSCGDGSILAPEERFAEVVDAAISAIQREHLIWVARLSWNSGTCGSGDLALERNNSAKMSMRALDLEVWNRLHLDPDYELFLQRLGSQTRRNMRYYRRRAEQAQWMFVERIERDEASVAMDLVQPFGEYGHKDRAALIRYRKTLENVPGVFYSGLRTTNGEWISIVGGWVKGKNVFIFMQMNNANYAKASVSTVLRAYVIEQAIGQGKREMRFIDGCQGMLKKYCRTETSHLLMRQNSYISRIVGQLIRRFFPSSTLTRLISESLRA